MQPRALITGITGQVGSYLAEYLLDLGYEVHGLIRRVGMQNQHQRLERIAHLLDHVELHSGSLESYPSLSILFSRVRFDECYHLAAQSFVSESFLDCFSTLHTNITGTGYMLTCIKELQPHCKFYFSASAEMFGKVQACPQTETTPFYPRSPYGVSKVTGFHLLRNFRESYRLFCCAGILFNHESPRRGIEFVTRKITYGVARIAHGLADSLLLGNLEARRDWGHAREFVSAMHRMLQQPTPDDYVLATGETHTVREFCDLAFQEVGLDYQDYVQSDPQFYRPAEVDLLRGDASKAKACLGWEPQWDLKRLVHEMVTADLARVQAEVQGGREGSLLQGGAADAPRGR
jgi:GDPmannose 4,6-dehydratase